jgi:hypothetical protein
MNMCGAVWLAWLIWLGIISVWSLGGAVISLLGRANSGYGS